MAEQPHRGRIRRAARDVAGGPERQPVVAPQTGSPRRHTASIGAFGRLTRIGKALAGVVLAGGLGFLVLSTGPWLLTRHPSRGLTSEQQLKAKNDARTTLVQAVGAAGLLGGLFFTYRTFRLTRSQQVTDRYIRAVEQLGSGSPDVRTGAIYALERITVDSPDDRRTVIAVLASFAHSRPDPPAESESAIGTDLQAAITVIGRRRAEDDVTVDLTGARLAKANLSGANLSRVVLVDADLSGSILDGSDLSSARLSRCSFAAASLAAADLRGADLRAADLTTADLRGARLAGADLTEAKLRGARLVVGSLTNAQLAAVRNLDGIIWSR
jgi:Pentapeptide repeats (8 copies)